MRLAKQGTRTQQCGLVIEDKVLLGKDRDGAPVNLKV